MLERSISSSDVAAVQCKYLTISIDLMIFNCFISFMQNAFKSYDRDRSGTIDAKELRDIFKVIGRWRCKDSMLLLKHMLMLC